MSELVFTRHYFRELCKGCAHYNASFEPFRKAGEKGATQCDYCHVDENRPARLRVPSRYTRYPYPYCTACKFQHICSLNITWLDDKDCEDYEPMEVPE